MSHAHSPRTIIITGASAGVGRALAHRFARAGDRIGLIARDPEPLAETADEIKAMGARAAFEPADVADAGALFEASAKLQQTLGPVDVWINDAMETVFSPLESMSADEFRRVTEVTYLGFVYGTMAALKTMRPRGRGLILQVGSALAYRGIPLQSAYCGAKHAIRGFTDSLRVELIHERSPIQLMMVQLPAVNTPQFDWARERLGREPRPAGTPVEPEAIADAIFRAARRPRREYWLGGQTWATILGNALLPGLFDRYLAREAVAGQEGGPLARPERAGNLDEPVTALHRTRGSYSLEASDRVAMAPESAMRLGAALAAGLVFAAVGYARGAAKARRGPRAP